MSQPARHTRLKSYRAAATAGLNIQPHSELKNPGWKMRNPEGKRSAWQKWTDHKPIALHIWSMIFYLILFPKPQPKSSKLKLQMRTIISNIRMTTWFSLGSFQNDSLFVKIGVWESLKWLRYSSLHYSTTPRLSITIASSPAEAILAWLHISRGTWS